MTTEHNIEPFVSEEAEPLKHIIGNEYNLQWRSVWIHTPQEAVRVLYKNSRLEVTIVRKGVSDEQ